MTILRRITLLLACLLLIALAVFLVSSRARPYEDERFSFTIPWYWQTMDEIWNQPASSGQDYYGLGVQQIVMIQYPARKGQGKAFFAVASSPLADGQDLESRFEQAYQAATPEIKSATQRSFELGELSGYEITYQRPWGEPWWQFRDIWVEKDGVIYVFSFHASPYSFEKYSGAFDQILESFRFRN